MTIKSLQITNLQQEEIIHNLQQKYEAIAQLATNPASPATLNIKNQTSGMDLQSFSRLTVEDMVDKIVEL